MIDSWEDTEKRRMSNTMKFKNCSCEICGNKFRQMLYENEECCLKCRNLIRGKSGVEIAKIYYKLGRKGVSYGKI